MLHNTLLVWWRRSPYVGHKKPFFEPARLIPHFSAFLKTFGSSTATVNSVLFNPGYRFPLSIAGLNQYHDTDICLAHLNFCVASQPEHFFSDTFLEPKFICLFVFLKKTNLPPHLCFLTVATMLEHIQRLMGHYEKVLGVDKERIKVKRGDVPFVGRVLRRQVLDAKGSEFLTIDAIDVYLNEQVPQGMPMTLLRHVHTLTRWDLSSGLPSECTIVSKRETRTHWKPLVRPGIRSWLFCWPHTLVKHSFTYSTSRVESPMRHSNDKPFSYQQFIPKRPEDDLDPSFMPCGSPGSSPQRPPPKFHFG